MDEEDHSSMSSALSSSVNRKSKSRSSKPSDKKSSSSSHRITNVSLQSFVKPPESTAVSQTVASPTLISSIPIEIEQQPATKSVVSIPLSIDNEAATKQRKIGGEEERGVDIPKKRVMVSSLKKPAHQQHQQQYHQPSRDQHSTRSKVKFSDVELRHVIKPNSNEDLLYNSPGIDEDDGTYMVDMNSFSGGQNSNYMSSFGVGGVQQQQQQQQPPPAPIHHPYHQRQRPFSTPISSEIQFSQPPNAIMYPPQPSLSPFNQFDASQASQSGVGLPSVMPTSPMHRPHPLAHSASGSGKNHHARKTIKHSNTVNFVDPTAAAASVTRSRSASARTGACLEAALYMDLSDRYIIFTFK